MLDKYFIRYIPDFVIDEVPTIAEKITAMTDEEYKTWLKENR